MALSAFDILITLPANLFALIIFVLQNKDFGGVLIKEPNWDSIHSTISEIYPLPADDWRDDIFNRVSFYYSSWANIAFSISFFALFGFTQEMRCRYKKAFCFVFGRFGFGVLEGSASVQKTMSGIRFGSIQFGRRRWVVFTLYFLIHTLIFLNLTNIPTGQLQETSHQQTASKVLISNNEVKKRKTSAKQMKNPIFKKAGRGLSLLHWKRFRTWSRRKCDLHVLCLYSCLKMRFVLGKDVIFVCCTYVRRIRFLQGGTCSGFISNVSFVLFDWCVVE